MRAERLTSIADLAAAGLVPADDQARLAEVAARYAVAITPDMAALIPAGATPGSDPIARQFVPDARELLSTPDERADPIGDDAHSPVTGVVHRHADRVLLKLTGLCPVYCRFCFRREMIGPGAGRELSPDELTAALAYIAARPDIFEVILTGGDPLILSPRRIADVTRRLSAMPHVRVLRWHSRVPVVAPGRITADAVAALTDTDRAVYVAVHTNHPRELTADARAALRRMADGGIVLISQTVLLAGINDNVETLAHLMRELVTARVKPYYLHHPDLAPGTSHFRLTIEQGQRIVSALREKISGLAQPTYVLDIPGGIAKVPIGPDYLDRRAGGMAIRDPAGRLHAYTESDPDRKQPRPAP